MAAERSSLKRKALADCTNTIPGSDANVRRKASLRSAVTTQPPGITSVNNYEAPTVSLKSNTSTGSNSPQIFTTPDSTLLIASRGSENQETNRRKDKRKAVVEDTEVVLGGNENRETKRRKGKGKEFVEDTTTIFGDENQETNRRKDKGKAVVEHTTIVIDDENQETKTRKDKGKAIVEDSTIVFGNENIETSRRKDKGKAIIEDSTIVFGNENIETSRRKDKGKAIVEDVTVVFGKENLETQKRKDKGKAVVEDTTFGFGNENREMIKRKDKGKEIAEYTTVVFGDDENHDINKRKDKGKAVIEEPTIVLVADENQERIKWKDKGKAIVEDTTVVQLDPPSPFDMNPSSAPVSATIYPDRSKCRTVYTRKRVPDTRILRSVKITEPFSCPPATRLKDKGKQVDDGGGDGKSGIRKGSYPAHKKQSRAKAKQGGSVDAMPKEEVEKLSAYYKEIDAFELPVEEAKAGDSE